jgi:uncharacterized protein YjiS (DUF1127 family)
MTGSVPSITLSSTSQHTAASTRQVTATNLGVHRHGARQPEVTTVRAAWAQLRFINRVWRERRMLASLDDSTLKDIGLNRADVEREAGRSPFDLPQRRNRWE